jgi:hypothetical protein
MRTTLSLDDDVAAELRRRQKESGRSWKEVVNDSLRAGMSVIEAGGRRSQRTRRTKSVRLGTPRVSDIANVHEVLSVVEGDGRR